MIGRENIWDLEYGFWFWIVPDDGEIITSRWRNRICMVMGMLPALTCACSNDERNSETCRRWQKQAVAVEEISKFSTLALRPTKMGELIYWHWDINQE
jgi:hypothetical protein